MAFWNNKPNEELKKEVQTKLNQFGDELHKVVRELNSIKDDMTKLEIKALESRKMYHKKLNQMYGDKKEEEEEDINTIKYL